jgi:hypothetical protein
VNTDQKALWPAERQYPLVNITRLALPCCIITVAICQVGCSRPSNKQPSGSAAPRVARVLLSPSAAAELAAKLANDECEHLHQKRPFTAQQHAAVLKGDLYRWGRLDPGGPSGLSAVVTFRADGSEPDVQVYLSTDIR